MLESFFQKLFDQSSAMQALRKAAKKATILGVAEGLGCDMAQAEVEVNVLSAQPMKANAKVEEQPKPVQGMPLPKPQSIGILGRKPADEPDGPGVPPKRIRSKRRDKETDATSEVVPNAAPASTEPKGEGLS